MHVWARYVKAALQDNRIEEAVCRLENAVLLGERIELEALLLLPEEAVSASPLLQKARCEEWMQRGELLEARDGLKELLAPLAASGLRAPFLSALAQLAVLHIRIGQCGEAKPMLRFLLDERRTTDEGLELVGDVDYALARGCRLVEEEGAAYSQPYGCYDCAVEAYERDGQPVKAALAALDALIAGAAGMPEELWHERLAAFEQRVRGASLSEAYVDYARALRYAERDHAALMSDTAAPGQWSRRESRFIIETDKLAYPYGVRAELLLLRLTMAEGLDGEGLERIERSLHTSSAKEAVDLELRFEWLTARVEFAVLKGEQERALRLLAQAKAAVQMGSLAEGEARLARLEERVRLGQSAAVQERSGKLASESAVSPWRVRLFDDFAFEQEGRSIRDIRWKRSKTRELLLYLLLQPGYTARREQAAEALFPACEADKIDNRFYVVVHQLKGTLLQYLGSENSVVVKDGIIRLKDGLIDEADAERYMALGRVAAQLWPTDPGIAIAMMEQAVPMYGVIAPDMHGADWLESLRERLLVMQGEMLGRLYASALASGQLEAGEAAARERIRLQPLHEEAYQVLFDILRRQGRSAEAEYEFRRLSDLLERELGIGPAADTLRSMGGRSS